MYEQQKKEMKKISNYAGSRLDFVQGGGGNSSYKFDNQIMAIKASGYTMLDITEYSGYVTVNYAKLLSDYAKLSTKMDVDVEAETLKINLESITPIDGNPSTEIKNVRPSVEVGFHSYLKKAVIHTHSVYSNLLCCSKEGEDRAEKIFKNSGLGYVFLPFISPGFTLSLKLAKAVTDYEKKYGKQPEIILMQSHGIIAHADDANTAINIHEKANNLIMNYFKVSLYPSCSIEKKGDDYISKSDFLQKFIIDNCIDTKYFDEVILYPDQMVYLGSNLLKTIIINTEKGEVVFKMSEKKALTALEVMIGAAYIISEINSQSLTLKTLCNEGVEFIRNWESEKYRANL